MQSHHHRRLAFAAWRVTAPAWTARQRQAQDRFGHPVLFNELPGEFFQRLWCERQIDFQKVRAARQPIQMFREPEWLSMDDAHCFKQAVAQQKAAVVHRDHGLRFGDEFTIEENNHAFF